MGRQVRRWIWSLAFLSRPCEQFVLYGACFSPHQVFLLHCCRAAPTAWILMGTWLCSPNPFLPQSYSSLIQQPTLWSHAHSHSTSDTADCLLALSPLSVLFPHCISEPVSHCLPLCLSLFSCIKLPFRERSAKAQVLREIHLFLRLVLFISLIKTHGSMTEQSCDWALPL